MANITRIKATDPHAKREKSESTPKQSSSKKPSAKKSAKSKPAPIKAAKSTPTKTTSAKSASTQKPTKTIQNKVAKSKKSKKAKKPRKVPAILKPFAAFGRYAKASWGELRTVRWPSRKYTWKMTAAMMVYCVFFLIVIVLLDLLFTFIFNELLK